MISLHSMAIVTIVTWGILTKDERIVHLTNLPSGYQFHTETTRIHCHERFSSVDRKIIYYNCIQLPYMCYNDLPIILYQVHLQIFLRVSTDFDTIIIKIAHWKILTENISALIPIISSDFHPLSSLFWSRENNISYSWLWKGL